MSYETLLYTVEDGICTLTLNRPEKLNTFTAQMKDELIGAFDRIDADDDVKAVIVTGAGRAFCAGADLSQGANTFDYARHADGVGARYQAPGSPLRADGGIDWGHEAVRDAGGRVTLRIFDCLKPVIAAINGVAAGFGATMPLAMDIRIASEEARFGFVFTRRGLVPEACSTWFLPRIVGVSQALEWCCTGRVFPASEALAGGLVSRVAPAMDLMPMARQVAQEIIANTAPVATALTRQMMWRMLGADHPMEAHKIDSRVIYALGTSADVKEGVTAFLEKRPARYPDRVSRNMPAAFPWWTERTYS